MFDVVFSEWLGFDYDLEFEAGSGVAVRLAGDPNDSQLTLPDVFFATSEEDWLKARSLATRPLARLKCDPPPGAGAGSMLERAAHRSGEGWIPILFGEPAIHDRVWEATDNGLALSLDVFGSVFYFLTLYEEAVLPSRDRHERFPGNASLAAMEGFLDRPIVDDYVDLLWAAMSYLWPALARRPSTFRLLLTHDVDEPWAARRPRALLGDLILRHDPSLAARRLWAILNARVGRVADPFNTFDLLMGISERYGLESTFYFLAGNREDDFDFRYRLSDRRFAGLLRRIHERGHQLGLHASYLSHRSAARIHTEFDALRTECHAVGVDQSVWGVRQHYLRFENPQTWRHQDSAGFDHDSTIGFVDQIGFRAGTCREYPVFDLLERQMLRLRERPLLVMDGALLEYVAHSLDDAASRTRAIVDACRTRRGDAVLLFHNHTLARTHYRRLYLQLVEELARSS